MLRIENTVDCCGCGACEQICPKHCISLIEDTQGFLYPAVGASICVDCGLCEKVCPSSDDAFVSKKLDARPDVALPIEVLAAKNPDASVRKGSSSGGVFSMLAESVIAQGGVVFGAMFNDSFEVVHGFVEDREQLSKLRGSKYVQSRIGNSFREVEHFLKEGRKVLFSGTPCQAMALRNYLTLRGFVDFRCSGGLEAAGYEHNMIDSSAQNRCDDPIDCYSSINCSNTDDISVGNNHRNEICNGRLNNSHQRSLDNLLIVDIVCHGVPSPMIWRDYLSYSCSQMRSSTVDCSQSAVKFRGDSATEKMQCGKDSNLFPINFRDKSRGWRNYRVVIGGKSEYYAFNPFMAGFLQNYYLRPSCYSCPVKGVFAAMSAAVDAAHSFAAMSAAVDAGEHPVKADAFDKSEISAVYESDITLGDYWGIETVHPEYSDDAGVSLVLVNSRKGVKAMSGLAVDSLKSDFTSAVKKNPSIVSDPARPAAYDDFWAAYKEEGVAAISKFATTPSKVNIFKSRIKCLIKRTLRFLEKSI